MKHRVVATETVRRFHEVCRIFDPAGFINDKLVLIATCDGRLYSCAPDSRFVPHKSHVASVPAIEVANQRNTQSGVVVKHELEADKRIAARRNAVPVSLPPMRAAR